MKSEALAKVLKFRKSRKPVKDFGVECPIMSIERRQINNYAQTLNVDYYAMGYDLEESGDTEGAISAYLKVSEGDPSYPDAQINLGRLYHESNRLTRAHRCYCAALDFRPKDATALFNLGVVVEDIGDFEGAIGIYQETLTVDPQNTDAQYNLNRLLSRRVG